MSRPIDRRDMLGRFIEAKHPDGTRLAAEEILEEAMTVVAAGADTTGIALRGILYYIVRDSRVYEKVLEEIDLFASRGQLSDPPSYAEIQKLSYVCACIKEALRLHSPVGYRLPRIVPLGGRTISGNSGKFFQRGYNSTSNQSDCLVRGRDQSMGYSSG
jgi:cytochrome P450